MVRAVRVATVRFPAVEKDLAAHAFVAGGYQAPAGGQAYNPYGGGYQQPAYGAYDQQQYNPYAAPQPEQTAYVPPVRAAAPISTVPFSRAQVDPSAPPPVKAPTMSLKIGGGGPAKEPSTVSLKIGGAKTPAKAATPGSSKAATPVSSKPGTPTPAVAAAKTASAKTEAAKAEVAKEVAKQKEETAKTSDALLAEVKASADEETLEDLYGKDEEGALFCSASQGEELTFLIFAAMKAIKPHLNIVFIGHVDAGKSTMGGNILFLCGMVDKRTMEKYEREAKEAGRESWYLSWALDSTAQEREKVLSLLCIRYEHSLIPSSAGQDCRSRTRVL